MRGGWGSGVPQEKSRARAEQGRRSRCEGQAQGQPGREEVISVPGPGPGALGLFRGRPGPGRSGRGRGLHLRAQVPGKDVPAHTVLLPPHPVPLTHLPGWGRTRIPSNPGGNPHGGVETGCRKGTWRVGCPCLQQVRDRRGQWGTIELRVS